MSNESILISEINACKLRIMYLKGVKAANRRVAISTPKYGETYTNRNARIDIEIDRLAKRMKGLAAGKIAVP